MWMLCKKEWLQFFNNLTGYLAIIIFLLVAGLMLFVFPDTSLLEFGYADLRGFFANVPFLLLFLIPTVTMRSFADEYKAGTFEVLKTLPLTNTQIIGGKFLGSWLIAITAIIPTIIYAVSMQQLSVGAGLDWPSVFTSYIGLILLSGVFTAIGICTSSFTNNTVVAFILGAFVCFIFYLGFDAISKLPALKAGPDYIIEMAGINYHYRNISIGVIDLRSVIYFLGISLVFLIITQKNVAKR